MSKVVQTSEARRYVVQVRLTEREYNELHAGAEKTGLGMSELIRRALFDANRDDDN